MNHEEYFQKLAETGCPLCHDMDNINIQRRVEEQINYDEYWSIEDGVFQLQNQEDYSKEKRIIWYVVECNLCDYESDIDNIDLFVEASSDWNNKDIKEESFCKVISEDFIK